MDDNLYTQILQYLKEGKMEETLPKEERKKLLRKARYFKEINNQLYRKPRETDPKLKKVVPRAEMETLMEMMHNHPTAGHMGIEATYNKIKERYYWNQMYDDIKEYIKTCNTCQRFGRPEKSDELHSIRIEEPFERIGIDIVGPLPETVRKNRYIVVATEYLTKWPEARALEKANAENVAEFIYEDIICRHGTPKILLSDQGSHFKNRLIEELCKKFKINHRFSSPYHPQTNGMVERFNRTLCETLAKISINDIFNWDKNIPSALLAYRTTKHSTTKYTPFYLNYGREPILPIEVNEKEIIVKDEIDLEDTILHRIIELEELLPQHHKEAQKLIRKSQEKSQELRKGKTKTKIRFKEGNKVLMYDSRLDKQWSGKLEPKWKGPFIIVTPLSKGSYILKNEFGQQMKEPIHADRLKLYQDRTNWEPRVII